MVIVDLYKIPTFMSLVVVATILMTSILLSLWKARNDKKKSDPELSLGG